ncbi:MAG: LptF/LptG family permease [Deltaproteobacteria bacterium]|nr:LptF/LptG family permease [Deltaproteobacteria bacterium]
MYRTLRKLVWKELTPPFLLGLFGFSFILLSAKMVDLLEWVVERGIPLSKALFAFLYLLPSYLIFVFPMSLLLSILFVWGRFAVDNETIALKSSGYNLTTLSAPFWEFTGMVFGITLLVSNFVAPQAQTAFRQLLRETAITHLEKGIRPHVFTEISKGLVLYADQMDPDGELQGILISDERHSEKPFFTLAKKGRFRKAQEIPNMGIELEDGMMLVQHAKQEKSHIVHFSKYHLEISPLEKEGKEKGVKKIEEWNALELFRGIQAAVDPLQKRRLQTEWHRRLALPFACFVFAIIGVALGSHIPPRSAKTRGFSLSLAIFISYYLLLTGGETWVAKQGVSPALAIWFPNAFLGLFGVLSYYRAQKESFSVRGKR